jgi:hypothetical protein
MIKRFETLQCNVSTMHHIKRGLTMQAAGKIQLLEFIALTTIQRWDEKAGFQLKGDSLTATSKAVELLTGVKWL